jgi:hypothetical protein
LQVRLGDGQTQAPASHVSAVAQACPHAPQLAWFLSSDTQESPHVVCGARHTQAPAMHPFPGPHAFPQSPQLAASVCGSTHAPHARSDGGHGPHAPFAQT